MREHRVQRVVKGEVHRLLELAGDRLREAGAGDSTASAYMSHLNRLAFTFGDRACALPTGELESYIESSYPAGKSLAGMRQARSAIRFFYTRVLGRPDPFPSPFRQPGRSPLHRVFTRGEITGILRGVPDARYRTALMLVYSSGLTAEEATCLLAGGVDLDIPVIHVNDANGGYLRDTIVSAAAVREMANLMAERSAVNPYLLQGRRSMSRISVKTVQRAFQDALRAAGIRRNAALSDLRVSFAVHLMEDGIEKGLVRELLGLKTDSMLAPYLPFIRRRSPLRIQSPLDRYFR